MSRYLNTDKSPINLFKHFDDVKFKDFGDMLIYFEDNSKTNDFTFSLNKVFQLDSDTIDLFKGILTLFPLSFFSRKESIEFSKLETEIKRNNQIIDFNLRYHFLLYGVFKASLMSCYCKAKRYDGYSIIFKNAIIERK